MPPKKSPSSETSSPAAKQQQQLYTCPDCSSTFPRGQRSKHAGSSTCAAIRTLSRPNPISAGMGPKTGETGAAYSFGKNYIGPEGSPVSVTPVGLDPALLPVYKEGWGLFAKVSGFVREACVGVRVLMSPSSMKTCGVSLEQPVVLVTPMDAGGMEGIMSGAVGVDEKLQNFEVKVHSWTPVGDFALIFFSGFPSFRAESVVLKIQGTPMALNFSGSQTSRNELNRFLAGKMEGSAVFENQVLPLRYMGQTVHFVVSNVGGSKQLDFGTKAHSEEVLNISTNLHNLSLNESSGSLNLTPDSVSSPPRSAPSKSTNFSVPENLPDKVYCMDLSTKIDIVWPDENNANAKLAKQFADLGGFHREKQFLFDHVISPIKDFSASPESKKRSASCTLLLHGISGTGKSVLLEAVSAEVKGYCSVVVIFDLTASDLDKEITSSFRKASSASATKTRPGLILIDDIDLLIKNPEISNASDAVRKALHTLCQEMDRCSNSGGVFVLAATGGIDKVPTQVRRRFDVELEVFVPTPDGRLEILQKILRNADAQVDNGVLEKISQKAHGYTPSDLGAVCKFAKRLAESSAHSKSISQPDLSNALAKVRPTALREITLEVPKVHWSDIGGMSEVKNRLKEMVEWPLRHPEAFVRMGIDPPRGVLLYGPPGCSKTMIARALATESDMNFFAVKGPELFSKWVGESERTIRELFRKARSAAPSIIFFDEIDAIASSRSASSSSNSAVGDRVLTQLLTELDGVEPLTNVVVVAATNRPDTLDAALLRPGRFDRLIYIPLPDSETRKDILTLQFHKIPLIGEDGVGGPGMVPEGGGDYSGGTKPDIDARSIGTEFQEPSVEDVPLTKKSIIDRMVSLTAGFSGAEIKALCQEAALKALSRNLDALYVTYEDVAKVMEGRKPRISPESLSVFDKFAKSSLS